MIIEWIYMMVVGVVRVMTVGAKYMMVVGAVGFVVGVKYIISVGAVREPPLQRTEQSDIGSRTAPTTNGTIRHRFANRPYNDTNHNHMNAEENYHALQFRHPSSPFHPPARI